jgi:protein-S-isoprenylcysteine O-methyltransferase Ste14
MRVFWILFGVGTQILFALTVCRLFPFLQGRHPGFGLFAGRSPHWYQVDAVLAVQFAVLHSWLLLPQTRARLERWIPGPLYGCVFATATCLSLLLTIECWQPSPTALWRLHGLARSVVGTAFVLTWGALLYSLSLTGLGYQTGWTPWWAWARGHKPPRRTFAPRGAYHWLRHPIYLSFLGLVWLTPVMTLDRAVLTAVWTTYIFVGSHLKDRRLLYYLGDVYRRYQARVPGYPFFVIGPLARVPLTRSVSSPGEAEAGRRGLVR